MIKYLLSYNYYYHSYNLNSFLFIKISSKSKITQKQNKEIAPWIPAIRNHFWYSSKNCKGSELEMKSLWLGLLQHICGELNSCSHEEMLEPSEGKSWPDPNSQSMKVIRRHCMNKQWLGSFKYYVRNRYTGAL